MYTITREFSQDQSARICLFFLSRCYSPPGHSRISNVFRHSLQIFCNLYILAHTCPFGSSPNNRLPDISPSRSPPAGLLARVGERSSACGSSGEPFPARSLDRRINFTVQRASFLRIGRIQPYLDCLTMPGCKAPLRA